MKQENFSSALENDKSLPFKQVISDASLSAYECVYNDFRSNDKTCTSKHDWLAQIRNPESLMPSLTLKVNALLNNRISRSA
jgi:hypothetical protein